MFVYDKLRTYEAHAILIEFKMKANVQRFLHDYEGNSDEISGVSGGIIAAHLDGRIVTHKLGVKT